MNPNLLDSLSISNVQLINFAIDHPLSDLMKFLSSKIVTPVSSGEFNRLLGEALSKIPSKKGKYILTTYFLHSRS